MRRTAARTATAAVALALLLSACGSRVPERDFAPTAAPPAPGAAASNANTASDVGVTPNEITVGMVDTASGLLGKETFSGPMYGAQAFFKALNDKGGVNGRKVKVVTCDDQGFGLENQSCVRKLIDQDKVFAFAGNSIYKYDGAGYVSSKGVPDVGGIPIGNAYDTYQHLYSLYGSSAPRDGQVGWNGTLFQNTGIYRYFKEKLGARTAAVVSYNQADSARYAETIKDGLKAEGYTVVDKQVDFVLSNFDAAVVDMKNRGVDIVFDAIDTRGNAQLCKAMDGAGLRVQAKVSTVQNQTASAGTDFKDSPSCRNTIQVTGTSRNYEDVSHPAVREFRDAMAKYFPDRAPLMSQWALEGWASAQWLTDAVASCGATVTRACVEAFVNRPEGYDGHGLLIPVNFNPQTAEEAVKPAKWCTNVVRWQDSANGGKGGWVDQVPDMNTNCAVVPSLPYKP
ncbi:ABC transporter substrate-binding protein [Yinghuangia seranimata]|uniref:ABC transporter substrate-binding protein n=1 Tax=Yinghuangia seranimata TaxID=408067 RepID=UPI00248AA4F2|nr:ABC transporter substrate-binding protein [Yinghuangia seranimata]MDI2126373.1 ABC transporter substrate-binding protein [Yinghuangia seranimata]